MDRKSVLTDSSRIMTGCGRVGQNRLLDPVFRTLRKSMNRLRFRFDPKREKNRTKPDLQTLKGLFQPTVMFFGMCNSPATFQAMMDQIFVDMIEALLESPV